MRRPGAGDIPTFQQSFSPEVAWHEPGMSPVSGDFKGIQELLGLLGKTVELSGRTFKLDLHDLLANDEHAVGLITASAQREGKAWSDNQVNVFHIKEGKITEFWNHPGDLYAKDEFWS
jgi:ketosteroid isomerase-like protein